MTWDINIFSIYNSCHVYQLKRFPPKIPVFPLLFKRKYLDNIHFIIMSKSARWTFTVPNPNTWRPAFCPSTMHYIVWEMETCPSTGTPHIQGYVRMKTRRLLSQMKLAIHQTAHLEPARGTEEENLKYCSKEREAAGLDWGEDGQFEPDQGKQGRRTDITQAVTALKEGGIKKVQQEYPEIYVKYHCGLEKLEKSLDPPPQDLRNVTVTILWGPPGVGKTWRVFNQCPSAFKVRPGRDPFSSYNKQTTIVFDEFDYEKWAIETLNEMVDKYPYEIDCRYANKFAYWTHVIFISNVNPLHWWQYQTEIKRTAFFRRISEIIEVTSQTQEILIETQLI